MSYSQAVLLQFANTVIGRGSDYALQQANGRYVRIGSPVTYQALQRHLDGKLTMGTYVLGDDGCCGFAVFDADHTDGLAVLVQLHQRLAMAGIASSIELSRRGAHLWVFLAGRVPAALLRRWLLPYCPAGVEFYPKQESTKGYGSLMRVPLGVHRLTGRRYPFVTWQDASLVPVASSIAGVLSWLVSVERVIVPHERTLPIVEPVRERDPHTSLTKNVPCSPRSPFTSIEAWCAAQEPFDLIGQYVELDRRGMGQCPFGAHHSDGKDSHPSFRVYAPARPGGCCWHCYTVGLSGNVFNFVQLYYGLDAKTLWSRILAGESF